MGCHPLAQGAQVLHAGAGAAAHGVGAILLRDVEVLELLSLDEHGGGWRVGSWHIQRTVLGNGDAQMARALGGGCVLGKVALRGTAQGLLICKTLRNGRNGDRVALRGPPSR